VGAWRSERAEKLRYSRERLLAMLSESGMYTEVKKSRTAEIVTNWREKIFRRLWLALGLAVV